MTKTKNTGLSMSLILILFLLVIALGITIFKTSKSGSPDLMDNTNVTDETLFVEPTTAKTTAPISDIDKALNQLNANEKDVDSSFKDTPVTDL